MAFHILPLVLGAPLHLGLCAKRIANGLAQYFGPVYDAQQALFVLQPNSISSCNNPFMASAFSFSASM